MGSVCAQERSAASAWAIFTLIATCWWCEAASSARAASCHNGPRIADLVSAQLERRRTAFPESDATAPLFTFDGRRCIHPGTASQVFHSLVRTLRFTIPDGVSPPRLHDLRHSFAVGCLLRWYRDGSDPASKLNQLSTFMGHVDPTSTAVYLSITPGLLSQANLRFEAFVETGWAEPAP